MLPNLANTKEGLNLKLRIEECEQAGQLANGGCLTLTKRDLQLNLRRVLTGKRQLPWELEAQLCVRECHDLFEQLPPNCPPGNEDLARLLDSFFVWSVFVPEGVEDLDAFSHMSPSFKLLAAKISEGFALAEVEDGHEDKQHQTWQALLCKQETFRDQVLSLTSRELFSKHPCLETSFCRIICLTS